MLRRDRLTGCSPRKDLVRRFVRVVDAIAGGSSPGSELGTLAPEQPFTVVETGNEIFVDPASFDRYDAVGEAIARIDADAAVAAYRLIEPLADEVYSEIVGEASAFRPVLMRALTALLAVPVVTGSARTGRRDQQISLRRHRARVAVVVAEAPPANGGLPTSGGFRRGCGRSPVCWASGGKVDASFPATRYALWQRCRCHARRVCRGATGPVSPWIPRRRVSLAALSVWTATPRRRVCGRDRIMTWPCSRPPTETVLADFDGSRLPRQRHGRPLSPHGRWRLCRGDRGRGRHPNNVRGGVHVRSGAAAAIPDRDARRPAAGPGSGLGHAAGGRRAASDGSICIRTSRCRRATSCTGPGPNMNWNYMCAECHSTDLRKNYDVATRTASLRSGPTSTSTARPVTGRDPIT